MARPWPRSLKLGGPESLGEAEDLGAGWIILLDDHANYRSQIQHSCRFPQDLQDDVLGYLQGTTVHTSSLPSCFLA